MKANPGFFLVIIRIVTQAILNVLYSIIGEPITNLSNITSNPPKKAIMLFSDWDRRIKKMNLKGNIYTTKRLS
jgi:hypothetical protein